MFWMIVQRLLALYAPLDTHALQSLRDHHLPFMDAHGQGLTGGRAVQRASRS